MKAIRIHERGTTDVMKLEELKTPVPGEGEVLIKVEVAGVNYSDVGQRKGNYPNLVELPTTLGNEVGGTIVARGPNVLSPAEGTRVVSLVDGGYAEYALAPASAVIPLPDEVSFAQATMIPIQGQTAYLLLNKAGQLQKGERLLIHAASGGVGSLAIQLAKLMGVGMTIGTANSPDKLEFIRGLGVDVAINADDGDWVEQVMKATDGQGVNLVLESIGGGIGQQTIGCLALEGRMIVFGSLSDEPTAFFTQMLIGKCLTVRGYNTVVQGPEDKRRANQALLRYMAAGQLQVFVERTFPLADAALAHQAIEAGITRGKIVLTV